MSIFIKNNNTKARTRNGPNGITCYFSFNNSINDIGRAINDAKKITINPSIGSKVSPTTNINFISAPPKDSFLNKKFPSNINKYITPNINKPYNR